MEVFLHKSSNAALIHCNFLSCHAYPFLSFYYCNNKHSFNTPHQPSPRIFFTIILAIKLLCFWAEMPLNFPEAAKSILILQMDLIL